MQKRIAVLMVILLLFLEGCDLHTPGKKEQSEKSEETAELDHFLEEAVYDFSYEKPKDSPNILLNRNGYDCGDSKVAFLKGEELPEEFQVVDKKTKEIVFLGKLEGAFWDNDSGVYMARADFSDLQRKGTYYLQAKYIGQSYSFEIVEDRLETIYGNLIESFYYHRCGSNLTGEITVNNHGACHNQETFLRNTDTLVDTVGGWHTNNNFDKDVVESARMMSDLMLTYEFLHDAGSVSKESKEQEDMEALLGEVYYEVQFLLKMQDIKTGGFYGGVESEEALTVTGPEEDRRTFYVTDISLPATGECAAVLAQFGRIYKKIDAKTATECLNAAERAYTYLEKQQVQGELRYYAACELYKTTGYEKYSQYILQYLQTEDGMEQLSQETKMPDSMMPVSGNGTGHGESREADSSLGGESGCRIYGDIAYLTTTYKVDLEMCATLMNRLMIQAQEVSACAKADTYLVYAPGGGRDSRTILEGTFLLAIIDHIVTSHEYVGVMENQLDYLFGRNETGENLVTNKGILNSIYEEEKYDLYLQSRLVFILHELIEREAE